MQKNEDVEKPCCAEGWESVYVNLGHVYRKQQRWEEAETVFFKALALLPGQPSTYAALAFTYHLQV